MALSVVEIAMSLKKTAVKVAEGASEMFAQSGWAGFAGIGAMLAVMAGLGFSGGGSGTTVDMTAKDTKQTGTVLGNSQEGSHSIANVVKTLNDIHAKEYPELQAINTNFAALTKAVDKTILGAVQSHGAFIPSNNSMKSSDTNALTHQFVLGLGTTALSAGLAAAGVGTGLATSVLASAINASVALTGAASSVTSALVGTSAALMSGGLAAAAAMGGIGLLVGGAIMGLGALLGIGKTKYTAIGSGIITNAIQMTTEGMQSAVLAFDYSTIKAKTTGWFSDTVRIYDIINGIDKTLSNAFSSVFFSFHQSLTAVFKSLNLSDLVNMNYVIPSIKLTFTGKKDTEISDMISQAISSTTDRLASEIAGGLFAPFQKMGEGMLETIARVGSQTLVVANEFHKLGTGLSLTGMASLGFANTLTMLYESMPNANDGLKNFVAAINDFYTTVLTKTQQTQVTLSDYKKFVNEHPELGLDVNPVTVSRDNMLNAMRTTTSVSSEAETAKAALTSHGQDVQNAFNPTTTSGFGSTAWGGNATWKTWLNNGDYDHATWRNIASNAKTWLENSANLLKFPDFTKIVETLNANAVKQADGLAKLAGTGITSILDYQTKLAPLDAAAQVAGAQLASVTNNAKTFGVIVNDFQDGFKTIQESVLKMLTTTHATAIREQTKVLNSLNNTENLNVSGVLSQRIIDAFTKFTSTANGAAYAIKDTNGALVITTQGLQALEYSLELVTKTTQQTQRGRQLFTRFWTYD
jgi:hypothetical protein